jgi:hypothetical protein
MLAFIILLTAGFIFSSLMYGFFAKNAIAEPTEFETRGVIIGKKAIRKVA